MVFADLPREGLCNRIHVWARAFIFSEINNLSLYTHGWGKFRIGPFLRNEKSKRIYSNYFKCPSNIPLFVFISLFKRSNIVREHALNVLSGKNTGKVYLYHEFPRICDHDIFEELNPYREKIKAGFFNIVNPRFNPVINGLEKPVVGVHIRRGDFKLLGISRDNDFFMEKIVSIRSKIGESTTIHIFSDASESEIREILDLKNTVFVNNSNDLLDLIQLSFSRYLILSPESTFSLWAAFLSNGEVFE